MKKLIFLTFPLIVFGFCFVKEVKADTATFYSTASDVSWEYWSNSYITAHNAVSANYWYPNDAGVWFGQGKDGSWYFIQRLGLYFDTSSLPDDAIKSAAELGLFGAVNQSGTDFNMVVVSGADLNNPPVAADYGDLLNDTVSRGSLSTSGFTISDYNNIPLNSTGLNEISLTGTTKFGLRSSRDINTNTPTGYENVAVYMSEKGSGYKPRLVVTYTLPQYTLTVSKAGTGSGTVTSNPSGINCGSDCSKAYNSGTSVTLTAVPQSGSTFTGWSGDCSGAGTCTLSMTAAKTAIANFAAIPPSCQDHNVSGWAWSENIGWLSFSCKNQDSSGDYGVDISLSTGEFSGEAWSENIGWISFERTETGSPPEPPYKGGGVSYIAKMDTDSGEVTGWARALAYGSGWEGWIKLNDTSYGVAVSPGTGDFSGYAWSDMVIGWINFQGVTYKVTTSYSFNSPPQKPNKVGEGETWNNCSYKGKSIPTFSWTYSDPDGDPQAAYEIEVDSNSSFTVPKFNHLVNLAATSYALDLTQDDDADWLSELAWNTTYFWRVRVKDNQGNWSEWSNSDSFKTSNHAYPWPNFTWTPAVPSQGEVVVFNPDTSETYDGILSYFWTITQGDGAFTDETGASSHYPHLVFSTSENKIKLQLTDSDGYACESKPTEGTLLEAQLPLPEYQEVPPVIWFRKILAALVDFFNIF